MCNYPTSFFPFCQGSGLNLASNVLLSARVSLGTGWNGRSPEGDWNSTRRHTRRLQRLWSLASSLIELRCFLRPRPTDSNGSKVLTQPLSLGLTCMTYSLVLHALDGFKFLTCVNAEFEVLQKTLIRTMSFIPVRVSGVSLLSQAWWWSC